MGLVVILLGVTGWIRTDKTPQADAQAMSIEDAIAIAFENHPKLKQLTAEVGAARARVQRAKSVLGPQSGISVVARRQGPTLDFPTPPVGSVNVVPENFLQGGVTAQQLLFDGGRATGERRIAESGVAIAEGQLQDAKRILRRDVRRAYYGLLKAQSLQRVASDSLVVSDEQLKIARTRFSEGASPRFDVTRSEVGSATARQDLITSEKNLELARATLNLLLARPINSDSILSTPPGEPDAVPSQSRPVAYLPNSTPPLEKLTELALANRPEVAIARRELRISRDRIRVARAERMPNVNFNASYSRETSTAFQPDHNWFAGLNVTLALFDSGRARSAIRDANRGREGAEASLEQLRQSIEFDVKLAYLNLREASQQFETTSINVKSARENLEIARLRYNNGVGINLEVMDAQLTMSRALAQNVTAMYDYWIARADLEAAAGLETLKNETPMRSDG